MKFIKVVINSPSEDPHGQDTVDLLVHVDHIVSIKPILFTNTNKEVIKGYWMRLTNGKKYKVVQLPSDIVQLFEERLPSPKKVTEGDPSYNPTVDLQ